MYEYVHCTMHIYTDASAPDVTGSDFVQRFRLFLAQCRHAIICNRTAIRRLFSEEGRISVNRIALQGWVSRSVKNIQINCSLTQASSSCVIELPFCRIYNYIHSAAYNYIHIAEYNYIHIAEYNYIHIAEYIITVYPYCRI